MLREFRKFWGETIREHRELIELATREIREAIGIVIREKKWKIKRDKGDKGGYSVE